MHKRPRATGIIVADDHAVLRESLSALLGTQPDFRVLGKAANGREALELLRNQHADVLVLDLFMPETSGFEVLQTLDHAGNRVAAVVLTGSQSPRDYARVVRAGARGLVLKSDGPERLFAAIRSVAAGELAFSEDIARTVLDDLAEQAPPVPGAFRRLSAREQEIAAAVAQGRRNREIAERFGISENTVKRHLQGIFSKTGARDRLELAVMALSEQRKIA